MLNQKPTEDFMETKTTEVSTVSFNVSAKTDFQGFLNTEPGKLLMDKWKQAYKISRYIFWGSVGLVGALLLYYWFSEGFFSGILMGFVFGAIALAVNWVVDKYVANHQNKYWDGRWDHGIKIAEALARLLGTNYYSFYVGEVFFYSSQLCALLWVESGTVIVYQKENIKEVTLEHRHLGSTSTSTSTSKHSGSATSWSSSYATYSGKSKTKTTTQTVEHYKWCLDIYSNLMELPKMSLDFRDNEEDIAKQIYAVVKP